MGRPPPGREEEEEEEEEEKDSSSLFPFFASPRYRRQWQWYFAGYDTPRAVFPSFVDVCGDSTGAVLGQSDMPVAVSSGAFGQTVQKTADSPQLQSIAARQLPLRAANADPHGPVCSADHGDSTVAAYFGGRCSCCQIVQILSCCRGEALGAPTVAARREICAFLRAPCIWQSFYCVWSCLWSIGLWIFRETTPGMVSVLNTPRFDSRHIGVSLRGFLEEFHSPLYLAGTCTVFGARLWSTRVWIFWEMTPGVISVLSTPWFDSGYIYGVSLRCLLEEFPSYFNAMLGSTVDTSLCVRLWRRVFLATIHLALSSFVVLRPLDACHHGRYGPEGMLCVAVQKTADFPQLQFLAGRAVHPVVA